MRKAGGRVVLVAGLLALLFGVIRGYDISVHVEVEQHKEKVPKFVSHLELKDREESGFDFFVFSQAWPETYCKQEGKCCDRFMRGDRFVVHGLWPDYNNYSYPSCCSGPSIDENELERQLPFLVEYWPSMSCSDPKQCNGETTGNFWQLQWEQHGTCAYPTLSDWNGYVSEALKLGVKYNLLMYLLAGGIVPDNNKTYNTNKAIEVLKSSVKATPVFNCHDNKINEVWICLSKDLEVQDCPSGASSSCPEEFVFPVFWGSRSDRISGISLSNS